MSTLPSDYILEACGGKKLIQARAETAKAVLAKNILAQIAGTSTDSDGQLPSDVVTQLEQALQVAELRALDLMPMWEDDPRSEEGVEFREFCSLAFDLRRAIPKPEKVDDRLKSMMLLACVGVLGDRSADTRRYFRDNPWSVPEIDTTVTWAHCLFYGTADAFLRIVRKEGWADLEIVADRINELRRSQKDFEAEYLKQKNGILQAAALELIAFYHLAKAIEVLALFVGTGTPTTALDEIEFHATRAGQAADDAGIVELSLLLRWVGAAAREIFRSTIWHQLAAYNDKITAFKQVLTSKERIQPLFELLPPQREAIQELMNISNRALVVEMPTSSGKTLLAEFRIIQTKVNVAESWIAYLVPTRALVNQITARLRRDLLPLGIKVEQVSPAIEIDAFEDEILTGCDTFDVLVTTPEKLDLLVRSSRLDLRKRPLGLVILDEAHNISDGERGLRAELLLSTINRESPDTHFLLLTPFIPNGEEVAKWLDEERSKSIKPSFAVDWQPNDRLIGLAFPRGHGRNWGLYIKPLHTSRPSITFPEEATLEQEGVRNVALSKLSRKEIAAEVCRALSHRGCSIVLAKSPKDAWDIARYIAQHRSDWCRVRSPKIELVRRFVETEYGDGFALASLLEKGIGVHHAGMSPETRYLLEWLVEENELKALVATTTLAQGVNFPISSVVLSSYHKPQPRGRSFVTERLSPQEFWNIAGRAGRLFQDTLGLVLFASRSSTDRDVEEFVSHNVELLASALEEMVAEAIAKGWELDFRRLVRNDAKWSCFVQFLSHTYRQLNDHSRFLADTEMLLRRTYAYRRLSKCNPEIAQQLLQSARAYADQLRNLPNGVASLVDTTGFSPETIVDLLARKSELLLAPEEWSPSQIFRADGRALKDLVGGLLRVRELDIEVRGTRESDSISEILRMWVNGSPIHEIAEAQFSTEKDVNLRITECCRVLFQKLLQQVAWGMAGIQNIADVDLEAMTPEQRETFRTLPAMVYYGCNTLEGVLMRILNVPRSLSLHLGEQFKTAQPTATRETRVSMAREWLKSASRNVWEEAARGSKLSGWDYRNIWLILNGEEPVLP